MPILNQDDLIDLTQELMGGSSDRISIEGYETAASQTEKELTIIYPIADDVTSYWSVVRMRRHSIYILMVESAHKFQYKHIHLEHRFKHYIQLIEKMDKEWLDAMDDNPDLFGSVYSDFSFYLAPGFVYDALGRDITYIE